MTSTVVDLKVNLSGRVFPFTVFELGEHLLNGISDRISFRICSFVGAAYRL